jgi:hypothetical protein
MKRQGQVILSHICPTPPHWDTRDRSICPVFAKANINNAYKEEVRDTRLYKKVVFVGQMDLSIVLHGSFELKMGQMDLSLALQKNASLVRGKLYVFLLF